MATAQFTIHPRKFERLDYLGRRQPFFFAVFQVAVMRKSDALFFIRRDGQQFLADNRLCASSFGVAGFGGRCGF